MIFIITGRPRNGKSIYALDFIEKKARAENRPVYYHGIKGIKFENWHELKDAKKWMECPPSSIILFDEAHHDFPNRTATSATPPHVLPLNEHGHHGYDMYFISQHPKFLDPNVRGLTQEHWHVVRHFGREKATVHRWDVCKSDPDNKAAKADSVKTTFKYPKERFNQYESSADHNVKENVPLKYKLLYIIPFVILALIGKVGYSWYSSFQEGKEKTAHVQQSSERPALDLSADLQPPKQQRINTQEKLSYYEAMKPEIPDVLESAPMYQAIHQPTVIPRPSACVKFKGQCKCWTQQATPYPASTQYCEQIVKGGFFIDDLPQDSQQVVQPQPLQPIQPIEPLEPMSIPPSIG